MYTNYSVLFELVEIKYYILQEDNEGDRSRHVLPIAQHVLLVEK